MRIVIGTAAALLLAGCGGDDDGGTALAGIYQLSSWTHNPDGCDQEGPSAAEESRYSHFFVRQDFFGDEEFISAVMCSDLEECRANAADTETRFAGIVFYSGSDDGGWIAADSVLRPGGETCWGQVFESVLTGEAGSAARIEREAKSVTDVPLDDMEECEVGAEFQLAASIPCEELTVVNGRYLEAI